MSTLKKLFTPGQRIPDLDDDDLRELVELVDEECIHRGWPASTRNPHFLPEWSEDDRLLILVCLEAKEECGWFVGQGATYEQARQDAIGKAVGWWSWCLDRDLAENDLDIKNSDEVI